MSRISPSSLNAIPPLYGRHPQRPPRVLVAEDDDDMRRIIVDALREDGYEVAEAHDGGRLLALMSAGESPNIDLLISDVRMPLCNGVTVLESMRRSLWKTPVIIMTAFADLETRGAVERLGAVMFEKPFALQELRTAVLSLIPFAR